MKKLTFVLNLFVLVFFISFNSANAQLDKTKGKIKQFNFSYWNDNFLLEDLIDDFIQKGKDDHVTGSVLFEFLTGKKNNYWTYNLEFNILTNKNDNYRADLLTFLFSKSISTSFGKIKTGLGFVGRSNFGGSKIQNFYHNLFGWRKVDLPYLSSTKIGLIVCSEINYNFIQNPNYRISGNLDFSFMTAAGPSKFFPSLSFSQNKYFDFQIDFGYVNYYKKDEWLKPIFKEGFVWKIFASKDVFEKLGIGLWLAKGLYGIEEEFHFGMNLSFGE